MRRAVTAAVVGLAAAPACYAPDPPSGAPCTDNLECPGDVACIGGYCGGRPTDAAADGAATMTVVVGEQKSQLRDTEIWFAEPNQGHGTDDHFSIDAPGSELGLLWFDVSIVPAGWVVERATLTLVTFDQAAFDGGTIHVVRMREPWDEATATWNRRATGQPWTAAGAAPPSRDPAPLAELAPSQPVTDYEAALPGSVIEEWRADGGAVNYGVAVVRGTTTGHVHMMTKDNLLDRWSKLRLELRRAP